MKFYPHTILIVSHMRSGSTLLEHILSTNDEIIGFGEQNRIYKNFIDTKKMEFYIRRKQRLFFKNAKYTVDQVLHNQYTPNLSLLNNTFFRLIFLVRSPDETISSIENLESKHYSIQNIGLSNSLEYYKNRLEYMLKIKKQTPRSPHFFLTYSSLIDNPDQTLEKLTDFLSLRTPLKKEYRLKESTGNFGDRSKFIKEGKIQKIKKELIELSAEEMIKLNEVYDEINNSFNFK